MKFDPTTFDDEQELSTGVMQALKVVETPQPESPDGSGYTTESNQKCYYRHGDEYITAAKVSNTGWSVWRYTECDEGIVPMERLGKNLNAQMAKRLALTTAIERAGAT